MTVDIAELDRLLAVRADWQPWKATSEGNLVSGRYGRLSVGFSSMDAQFIADAVNALPALLEAVKAAHEDHWPSDREAGVTLNCRLCQALAAFTFPDETA